MVARSDAVDRGGRTGFRPLAVGREPATDTMDRRKFLIGVGGTGIGASAMIGSGAFTRVESQRKVKIEVAHDKDAYLGLDGCPKSPNNSYTGHDKSGHLYVDMSPENPTKDGGQGINSDSFTWFDQVFQICNQGKQKVGVWIDAKADPDLPKPPTGYKDEDRVIFYLEDDPYNRIDSEDDAYNLKPGKCICVGIRTMSKGLKEGHQLLKDDEIVIHADADIVYKK